MVCRIMPSRLKESFKNRMGTFKIEDPEEAREFEDMTKRYMEYYLDPPVHFNFRLDEIHRDCQNLDNGGRIFTASFDLYVSAHLAVQEIHSMAGSWNEFFSKESTLADKKDDIFENNNAFMGRMRAHRYVTNFIFRYRSVWEKIFGLYFLIYEYSKYDKFASSKSKRRFFLRNFSKMEVVHDHIVEYMEEKLTDFDDKYRTPEVHGTGRIRKWTFQEVENTFSEENPVRIIQEKHWSFFMSNIGLIMEMFDDIDEQKGSE